MTIPPRAACLAVKTADTARFVGSAGPCLSPSRRTVTPCRSVAAACRDTEQSPGRPESTRAVTASRGADDERRGTARQFGRCCVTPGVLARPWALMCRRAPLTRRRRVSALMGAAAVQKSVYSARAPADLLGTRAPGRSGQHLQGYDTECPLTSAE